MQWQNWIKRKEIAMTELDYIDNVEKLGEVYDYLLEKSIVSEEVLSAVVTINGYNAKTLNYATGCRDFAQLKEERGE